jgi:type VI secretion system protein ImpE
MTARELFQHGQLREAIQALGIEVRDNPTDAKRRIFLFELLSFAGEYDRAEKHLNLLAGGNNEAEMGAVLYFSALHAERLRQEMFKKRDYPTTPLPDSPPRTGMLNGKPFETLEDSDPRLGERLEVYAAGAYLWIPFAHVESLEMEPPKRLRDTLWIPAILKTGPAFDGQELGQVLIPAISPLSCYHANGNVQLGRATEWEETEEAEAVPVGQKTLDVDGEDFPFLEIRKLEFAAAE